MASNKKSKKTNPLLNSILHKNMCENSQKIILLYSTCPNGGCVWKRCKGRSRGTLADEQANSTVFAHTGYPI